MKAAIWGWQGCPPTIGMMSNGKRELIPDVPHFYCVMGPAIMQQGLGGPAQFHILFGAPLEGRGYPEPGVLMAMTEALEAKPNCTSIF